MQNKLAEKREIFMDAVVCARESGKSAILAASGRFGGYRREPLHDVRMLIVESSPALDELKKAWAGYKCPDIRREYFSQEQIYAKILDRIKTSKYSATDVEEFSIALVEFQNEANFSYKAGFFLSALINNCQEDKFVIHTAHLEHIDHLGFCNTKNITVDGDVGDFVGRQMKEGTITLIGNAHDFIGSRMEGGVITVAGNAGDWSGYKMRGGTIIVRGNAGKEIGCTLKSGSIIVEGDVGESVGKKMEGGEIRVMGKYQNIAADIQGGEIFHKERRIFPM